MRARFSYIVELLSTFLKNGATLSLLAYGSHMVLTDQMTVGEYVAFNAIYGMLMAPLGRLVSLWDEIQEIRISYERVNDILAMPVERSEQNYELTRVAGYLRIENLSFRYEGMETPVTKQTIKGIRKTSTVGGTWAWVRKAMTSGMDWAAWRLSLNDRAPRINRARSGSRAALKA